MSPEGKRTFEVEWVGLARRLRVLLGRKGINPSLHDDLVQETALRLLSMWDSVDRRRPLWPLTVTIALNLLRDRGRHVDRDDLVADVPEFGAIHDVETAGLARIELERVRRAMGELSRSQRSALMKEIGAHALATAPDSSSDKMLRMRARRKLKRALENVSAVVALRLRRIAEVVEGAYAVREGAMSAASCMLCLMVGIGVSLAPPTALAPPAAAGPLPTHGAAIPMDDVGIGSTAIAGWTGSGGTDEPRAGSSTASAAAPAGSPARATKSGKGASSGGEDQGLISVLPQDDDPVVPPPQDAVTLGVSQDDPPPIPGGGPDDGTSVPPVPEPPSPPPAPSPPVSTDVPLPLAEEAETLL